MPINESGTQKQLILLLATFGKIISESSISTYCKDVIVKEGESTTLSCTFTEDIDKLRKDFKVELYSNTHETPTPVLLCHWSRSGVLDCYEHDGYKYREHKGNTVTLNVLHASLEDTGKYACVLMSHSTPGTYKKCNLTVQALKKSESPSTAYSTTTQAIETFKESQSTSALLSTTMQARNTLKKSQSASTPHSTIMPTRNTFQESPSVSTPLCTTMKAINSAELLTYDIKNKIPDNLEANTRPRMLVRVTQGGEGHWLAVMLCLTLMTMLFQATVSTADPNSESVIVSRCEAPEIREGGNATLTCLFDHDLRNTKRGVKVVQYNSQTFDKTVLTCLWYFDEANCIGKYGFKLYGEISNKLRLINPRVTKEHAGTYACVVFDSEPGTQDTCFLNVVDGPTDPDNKEMFSYDCRKSDLGCDKEKSPTLLTVLITASILVAAVIILIVVVSLIMCKRNMSHPPGRSGDISYFTISKKH